ncbi:MAG: Nif3-like dinuclear metal center hexameric protein [Gammaproteobacteria bacterium]|nr:Nif3-like dinuclear metal center hexameric protein [Gammaproteobacteria bacterium]
MVGIDELVTYTNSLLDIERFDDYSPNGLQIEGRGQVVTLVSGVTANQKLIDAAIAADADAILVHHGYFWRGENPVLTGMRRRRIKTLLENDINLLAYHLPLDAHPQFGNNAALARELDFRIDGVMDEGPAKDILYYGRLQESLSAQELVQQVAERLGSQPLLIEGSDREIESIAWCSGAAQGFIEEAVALGVDAYLSGEISEQTTHIAREMGIHFIAAGHHATERYGSAELGEHLAEQFDLEFQFIDIDNPV